MKKVIIIDDEPLLRAELRQALELAGYEVEDAGNGRQALDIMRRSRPNLIVTDILMPDMDGVEIIRHARTLYPDAKIIAISDGGPHGLSDYLSWARKLGADTIHPKPIDLAVLLDSAASLLAGPGPTSG